ncbi:MAG: UDP-3-O-(3-hydroxymyristoyl)glucosamine N-acyltransferase [Melioribacteraceae bacterium]|nr:UDP-3-O-(3-hydroxymyristoyl)glucosamine N-acyltransferase [Melioribacteraceae bacterium]MCF8354936.1 UDP-3-O-(3-hydroxymyristoyl)glucosamine N-acyltransferase [Melioribacteraceae bacterium]MCF8392375.1 UDP-3-O-(3-hydroxymyristoyl)glucosamine N-acyltransferase [Melioribacteraceae bacterium]MCF8417895.1 UDP-3-O-(3-hydroxymyristoyl)glucosamine N-acyltransferase [Melioribacteraceae bacterium]
MELTIKEAADLIGGKIFGNPEDTISNVAKINEAQKGDLTFLYLSTYEKYLENTNASAVLVKPGIQKNRKDLTYIEVEKPEKAFQLIIGKYFMPSLKLNGIDESASIDKTAIIGTNTAIGKNVVISENCVVGDNTKIYHNTVLMEDVEVGSGTLIYPNVSIRENCKIGSNVIIHSNTVIGSDGFGYSPRETGGYDKIPQIGNVVVHDEVEIGSNVSIDRAAIGSTIIHKGTKIDNLVQVAHNVEVGENTALSAQTGIAGSTKIGKNCILAGQVGVVGHIEIGDGVIIGAQSGVSKSIKKPGKYFGYPVKELTTALRLESHVRNLPNYANQIKELEKKVADLENLLNQKSKEDN